MAELPRCGAAGGGEEGGSAGPANKLTDSGIHLGAPDKLGRDLLLLIVCTSLRI